jgi:hypothetical protein
MRPFLSLICITALLLSSCSILQVSYRTDPPYITIKDSSQSLVLIDAGNVKVPGVQFSKNREEVVTETKALYIDSLYQRLQHELPLTIILDSLITPDDKLKALQGDSSILAAISRQHNAALVMVLTDYSGGFSQDEVKKEKQSDGSTSKTAYYSVFFNSNWVIWQDASLRRKDVLASQPHSDRSVVSGLLARGPGYKANRKAIEGIANVNVRNVLELFKEQQVPIAGKKPAKKSS